MKEATLAELRSSKDFFMSDEIIQVIDGRKKEEVGFFVPKLFRDELLRFEEELKRKKRITLLKKIAKIQKKDPIEEGGVEDGLV